MQQKKETKKLKAMAEDKRLKGVDKNVHFRFNSKSNDEYPGEGMGERIPAKNSQTLKTGGK